ncbi:MAG TPA: DUF6531 domain-containing protein, partial [Gammaproteobacteria bacterium]|nr:DUF6531 domain-containing protein [Gammaproteobacteria bacterium]
MNRIVLLGWALVLMGYLGNAFAADEPPIIGNHDKEYQMYPSASAASSACGNEMVEINKKDPYPFAGCFHNSFGSNSGEYYVAYDYQQPYGPPQRVSSPKRYAYDEIQVTMSKTRAEAEHDCNGAGGVVLGMAYTFHSNDNPYEDIGYNCSKVSGQQIIRLSFFGIPAGYPSFPTYNYVYNQPPTVSVSSPSNGAVYYVGAASVNISGAATDPEDGNLSSNIKWYINGQYERQTQSFTKTFTSPGARTIKAEITDNSNVINDTASVSRTINVEEASLNISDIVAIMDSPHETYKPVRFTISTATVNGNDARASIVWQSSINGPLGTGGSITVNLSPGTHLIKATLSAYGEVLTTQKAIIVIQDRPHVAIQSPAGGRIFDIKEAIHFQGSLTFRGQPVSSGLTWVSDISGPFGAGDSFDYSDLPEGDHQITVSATLNGQTDTKTLTLRVYDRQKNQGNKNDGNCFGGNPINLLSGNKYHEETDFSTATESPLYLHRGYNSTSKETGIFGYGWDSNITERVEYNAT